MVRKIVIMISLGMLCVLCPVLCLHGEDTGNIEVEVSNVRIRSDTEPKKTRGIPPKFSFSLSVSREGRGIIGIDSEGTAIESLVDSRGFEVLTHDLHRYTFAIGIGFVIVKDKPTRQERPVDGGIFTIKISPDRSKATLAVNAWSRPSPGSEHVKLNGKIALQVAEKVLYFEAKNTKLAFGEKLGAPGVGLEVIQSTDMPEECDDQVKGAEDLFHLLEERRGTGGLPPRLVFLKLPTKAGVVQDLIFLDGRGEEIDSSQHLRNVVVSGEDLAWMNRDVIYERAWKLDGFVDDDGNTYLLYSISECPEKVTLKVAFCQGRKKVVVPLDIEIDLPRKGAEAEE